MDEEKELTQDDFDKDTDELLNKICDAFRDELALIANKYGCVKVSLVCASGLWNGN